MILATLAEAGLYASLGPRFAAGIEYLAALRAELPDGRHPIDGDAVFALWSTYETAPATEKRFESHVRHADIQFVWSGSERILYAPAADLAPAVPYSDVEDIAFHADPPASSSLLLSAGALAIFHPGDAHKPGCMAGGRTQVKKIVVKVRL